MFRFRILIIVFVLHCTAATSGNLDNEDLNSVFCWEEKRGHITKFPDIPPARLQSSCSTNLSQFGIYATRTYFKISVSGQGHASVQPRMMADGFTTTNDYSYLTLVDNKYRKSNELRDTDAFYFAPSHDCEWFTLHNRYTDLYNGYATAMEGAFNNLTILIMKYYLNSSTKINWINTQYLWKPVAVNGTRKKFRLVLKEFPEDFVTWTYHENKRERGYYLQIERHNDADRNENDTLGNEGMEKSLFSVNKITFDKFLLSPKATCQCMKDDFSDHNAASETILIPYLLYLTVFWPWLYADMRFL